MNHKHETGFSQFLCQRKPILTAQVGCKCLLQVNLAAAADQAGNAFGIDGLDDSVTIPALPQCFRTNENIVLVVGVMDFAGRLRDSKPRNPGETVIQQGCESTPAL